MIFVRVYSFIFASVMGLSWFCKLKVTYPSDRLYIYFTIMRLSSLPSDNSSSYGVNTRFLYSSFEVNFKDTIYWIKNKFDLISVYRNIYSCLSCVGVITKLKLKKLQNVSILIFVDK
ncbi:hypothetical protein EDEG_00288 [Edhazardia aedis USNM 41457]|uniref:Uncharacterized protein n=1 Tax=Edhazardia aedis (strain USNM 41457) TaxID=1003232 RepID=J9DM23_EDHAE|nr:hypothetical protein EDEG_00288 [Edhazardia aedis USNM 41457]|eukprot:EJW02432.1 hypothetical protein EDEG_00288 [Edhazardia aedis USNM 41457]